MPDNPTTRPMESAHTQAVAFLASIKEGSPEQDSLLWYENATHETRAAAFVQTELEIERLRGAWNAVSEKYEALLNQLGTIIASAGA